MRKIKNSRALFLQDDKIWVAKGLYVYAIDKDGKRITKIIKVGGFFERLFSLNRLLRQALRIGVHHLIVTKENNIFLTIKKRSFLLSPDGQILSCFKSYVGNKPGHQGVCVCPDGTIFFGEYAINLDHKKEIRLFRSTNGGRDFEVVFSFNYSVRHIHFIKFDPFSGLLWLGTGDSDEECFLMCSADNGQTWNTVGGGSQLWRAIGICFDKDFIYWGTDAGSVNDPSVFVRFNRTSKKIETLFNLEGPCHGCATFNNNKMFFSTGIEGGQNEKDNFAHLKEFCGNDLIEISAIKKDFFPLKIQYGVIRFPLGTEKSNTVVFTTFGLKNNGECVHIIKDNEKYK